MKRRRVQLYICAKSVNHADSLRVVEYEITYLLPSICKTGPDIFSTQRDLTRTPAGRWRNHRVRTNYKKSYAGSAHLASTIQHVPKIRFTLLRVKNCSCLTSFEFAGTHNVYNVNFARIFLMLVDCISDATPSNLGRCPVSKKRLVDR